LISIFVLMKEEVILVNENDHEIGLMEKIEAHEKGELHRAFSIFLFNDQNEFLLQKRASHKYHSPSLWTNTCCSHQRKGESTLEAAKRRLMEEMGITTQVEEKFTFIYRAELDQGLTEHELDHVLIGSFNGTPLFNTSEVEDYKYIGVTELLSDLKSHPERYTEWFKICLEQVIKEMKF